MTIASRGWVFRAAWIGVAAMLASCGGDGGEPEATSDAGGRVKAAAATAPTTFFPNVTIPTDANTRGMWSPVYNWPGVPVHMVLLSDGRLLNFGSNTTGKQGAFSSYDIWDSTGAPDVGHLTLPNGTGTDFFCSSAVMLPSESPSSSPSAFIAGGDVWTGTQTTNTANPNSNVVDVATGTVTRKTDMQRARWYSTSTTLVSGETFIQGGNSGADAPEVRSLTGSFRLLSGADTSTLHYSFPRNFVAPDGRIFGFDTNGYMYYVNPVGTGTLSMAGRLDTQFASDSGSAAMFRPGRILQIGGNSNGAAVIDITSGTPVVTPTQSLSSQRQWVDATILADGKVLATNGSQVRDQLIGVNTKAEIWDPTTGQWMQGPAAVKPRLYHSNAILLPDASVLVSGGGATDSVLAGPSDNLNAEIYYPPYFFAAGGQRASRPFIATAPDWIDIGSVIPVTAANATSISRVTLVKTGAATHSFNMDQRFLELTFTGSGMNLSVQAPTRAADAPPGYYMLFVFNEAGVPSVAKMVRMGIAPVANPATVPTITNPGPQTTDSGMATSLTLAASDPNGDALQYTAAGLPVGLSLNPTTGVISGTPTTEGSYNVTVGVSDGVNVASATFVWTVTAINGVIIDPLPPVVAAEAGTSTTFTASTTGGVNVLYRWNFGDGTGDTAWSPAATVSHTFASAGSYVITFSATDASSIVRTRSFIQTVYLPSTANKPSASSNIVVTTPASGNPRLWVVNQDNDSVSVFDTVTRAKLAEVTVGSAPRSVAVAANGFVWVTNKRSDSISVIDPASNTVVATIALPRGSRPHGLAMSPTAAQAFVVLEATGQLLKFDASSYAQLGSVSVGANARQLSITADGASVYVSRFVTPPLPGESTATVTPTPSNGAEVVVISASGMSFMRTIVLQHSDKADLENQGRGIPNYLGAATISPDGSQAWVPSKQDNIKRGGLRDGLTLNFQNTVRAVSSRIVLATNQEDLAKRVDHDNASVASAAVYDPRGVYLFVALETSREVAVVDAHGGFQVMRFDVGRAPQGLTLGADGKTLYVNNFMDRTVGVYDLQPLLTNGQLSVPLLATLGAVGSEKLAANVLVGKQFFYDARDPRLARDRYMSCASCHNDGASDGRTWDLTSQGEGLRNTIALRGRAGAHGLLHWSGNFDEVQDFEAQIRTLAGGTGLMSTVSFNVGTRSQPLGDPKAGVSAELDAMAAYVGSLSSFEPSPYRDASGALSTAGTAGRAVFLAQGCTTCHGGSGFTNSGLMDLQNVGTLKASSGQRLGGPLTGIDIPTLRDVWQTGTYLHDGSASTLEQAVLAHNSVSIGSTDLANLVQYLKEIGSDEASAPGVTGLRAAYGFNEGSGTTSADLSGGGHTATLVNAPVWATGQYGSALTFNGTSNAVTLGTPSTLNFGSSNFTLMMWTKRGTLGGTSQRHLFSKCHPTTWQTGCKELYFSGNTLSFGSFATGDTTSVAIADTAWHHIALVFTRATNTLQIYVDGVLQTTATKNLEDDDPTHIVTLGNLHGSNPYSGLMDEVRIYGLALTAAQVVSDKNTSLATTADTTPPVLSGAAPSGVLAAGTAQTTLSVTSNENATCRHSTTASTAYASMTGTFTTTGGATHSTTLTGLTNGTTYTYYVRCQDAAGNANAADLAVSFSVAAPDTTAPTVSVGAPAAGATVAGTVAVTASAADNVGVAGVQFLLDGANLGAEDTATPFTISWNSATASNGAHTITARARDAAGNVTTSAAVGVTVSNAAPDATAPTVSVSAPAAGATVTGAVNVTATAADNVGVAGVQFLLDGVSLGAEDTATPFTISWNTATATNGAHAITARARDAAGNTTVSAVVNVTVSNAAVAGLVTAFGFDEGSGTTSADLSGAGHTATLVNAPTWGTGQYGSALSFNGTNNAVTVANPSTLNFGSSNFTLMLWTKRSALGGTTQRHLFTKCDAALWMAGCKELYFSGNVLNFGSSATGDTTSVTIADTAWHHIAVVFTRATNTVQIYVDGTLRTTAVKNLEADDPTHIVTFGNLHGVNPYSGFIDEVRIYSTALTAAQVVSDRTTPLTPVADTTAPVLSGGSPSGVLAVGTTQTTLSVTSNENATCRYATTAGTAYASMTGTFATTGGTAHATTLTGLANGTAYTYYVRCQDAAGNANAADLAVSFSVAAPDTTAPTVSVGAPAAGATVAGTVAVTASAADNVGVAGVQFLLDGANLGAEDTATPFTISWNSATASNGAHTITARARDAAGNVTTSAAVSVTVSNVVADTTAPTVSVTAPAAGATVTGTVNVTATAADNVGVAGVQFLLDGVNLGAEDTATPFTISWNTATATNGAHALTARARDAAGNTTVSAVVNVTVNNAVPDATAPTVSLSAPAAGANVTGVVSVTATASDNVGVAGVQFLLDGVSLGAEDTATPFTISWNTATATNGTHTLTARARDAAGNQTTAAARTVTVTNTPPTGLVTALAFNEGSGTTSADLSGAGHTATLVNAPTWGTGQYGSALSFNGTNNAVTVANPSTLNFGSSNFTLMLWTKRSALGGTAQRHLFSKCDAALWMAGCKELYFSGNVLNFGSSATGDTTSVTIADTAWHHIAVVFTRATNTVQIYVDGTLRTTAVKNLEADDPTHIVTFGNLHGVNPYSGFIDEVRIYSTALTAAQVQSLRVTPLQ